MAAAGRPLPAVDVSFPVAQFGGQLSGADIAPSTGASRPRADVEPLNPADANRPFDGHLHEHHRRNHQIRRAVVPSSLPLQNHVTRSVAMPAFVGLRWAGDVTAELLQRFAVVGVSKYSRVRAETMLDGAQEHRTPVATLASELDRRRHQRSAAECGGEAGIGVARLSTPVPLFGSREQLARRHFLGARRRRTPAPPLLHDQE